MAGILPIGCKIQYNQSKPISLSMTLSISKIQMVEWPSLCIQMVEKILTFS